MIQKITKGADWGGLIRYLTEGRQPPAEILGGGNLLGTPDRETIIESGLWAKSLNRRSKRNVVHTSISISPGESLDEDAWREIASEYVRRMGYSDCVWAAVKHDDTEHPHIHIAVVRVDLRTRKVVKATNDYRRGEELMREFERRYGLAAPTPRPVQRRISRAEVNMAERGELSVRQKIASAIDAVLEEAKGEISLSEFVFALRELGIDVKVNASKTTGRVHGLSFELDGHVFKGSKLGKSYTWKKLTERGIYVENGYAPSVAGERENRPEKGAAGRLGVPGRIVQSSRESRPGPSPVRGVGGGERAPGPVGGKGGNGGDEAGDAPRPDDTERAVGERVRPGLGLDGVRGDSGPTGMDAPGPVVGDKIGKRKKKGGKSDVDVGM